MQLIFLFYLDLILHACKILLSCDSFGILKFATKQGLKWRPGSGWACDLILYLRRTMPLFSCIQNFKTLRDFSSHRIFEHVYEVLNVAKQNN